MAINAGYMGAARIGGGAILRFSDASIAPKQEVIIPDLVMGDKDHDSFYYGPITIEGNISGPIDTEFSGDIWEWAVKRDSCGLLGDKQLELVYFCDNTEVNSVTIPSLLANSVTISATAGDIANFSIDVIGAGSATYNTGASITTDQIRKIITWDAMNVTLGTHDGIVIATPSLVSAFEITINNNVTPAYSMTKAIKDLYPDQLITGIRTITGSLTVYNIPFTNFGALDTFGGYNTTPAVLSFAIGATTYNVNVKWARIAPTSSAGPVTSTIAFSGVGPQTSLDA